MKTIVMLWLGLSLFQVNLENFDDKYLSKSFVIVVDGIYCSGCFKSLIELDYLWKDEFNTILAVGSNRDKTSARSQLAHFRKNKQIDSLIFFEKKGFNDSLFIGGKFVEFMKTPMIIISNGSKRQIIWYDELFLPGIDTNRMKTIISQKLL